MHTTFWASVHDSPAGLLIASAALLLQLGFIIFDTRRVMSVRGTRQRYLAATRAVTLGFPAMLAVAVDTFIDFCAHDVFGVLVGILVFYVLLRAWNRLRDSGDDNWWKGRGKKLKKRLRSAASSLNSQVKPAAAGA